MEKYSRFLFEYFCLIIVYFADYWCKSWTLNRLITNNHWVLSPRGHWRSPNLEIRCPGIIWRRTFMDARQHVVNKNHIYIPWYFVHFHPQENKITHSLCWHCIPNSNFLIMKRCLSLRYFWSNEFFVFVYITTHFKMCIVRYE